ncbi:MAG TPA: aminopeptidase, partial [Arachidicoccus sp.]
WNKVWVNETGRPIVENMIQYDGGKIKSFIISQHPEYGIEDKIWQQNIVLSLYYKDTIKSFNINLSKSKQAVKQVEGLEKPLFVLLNASGIGYGVFQIDTSICDNFSLLKDPLNRATSYIELYENMLEQKAITPKKLLKFYGKQLNNEATELNLRLIASYLSSIYWEFISQQNRLIETQELEDIIWHALQNQRRTNNKKILFECYESIFQTKDAYQKLYDIWQNQRPPEGIVLTEDDYTSLALSLALRNNDNAQLLNKQLARIKNPDRINRFKIIMQAASSNKDIRDQFFNSLSQKENRTNESAIGSALIYLHHPLRQNTSVAYLKKSLDLLEEIQKTGDIFFPDSWLKATFYNYQNPDAMQIVEDFIKTHQNYNDVLKNKILQATDNLRRTQNLLNNQ